MALQSAVDLRLLNGLLPIRSVCLYLSLQIFILHLLMPVHSSTISLLVVLLGDFPGYYCQILDFNYKVPPIALWPWGRLSF